MTQIVILDDDRTFASMLRKGLLKHGLLSHSFDRVEDYLQSDGDDPDLFIVDLSMPDPSGVHWEFGGLLNIAKLREARGARAPIWVLTGYDDGRIERECLRCGADKIIFKREGVMETADDVAIHWNRRVTGNRRSFY